MEAPFEKSPGCGEAVAIWRYGKRAFQAKGSVNEKILMWEQAW